MLKIDEKISDKAISSFCRIEDFYKKEEVIMFDLETTGLSPSYSYIYIIGINYWKDGSWWITQLFNNDGKSEKEMLSSFLSLLSEYKYLIHFNGNNFDVPFVKKRAVANSLSSLNAIDHIESIDLYRLISPFKKILALPNLKQQTLERYFGINRNDQMSGGELINVYNHYLRFHDERSKELVLLHNRDDMEGMYLISSILSVSALTKGHFKFSTLSMDEKDGLLYLNLSFFLHSELIQPIIHSKNQILLSANKKELNLQIPVMSGSLYYFFGKAKDGCEAKNGFFIPFVKESGFACYRETISSKEYYRELNDSFLGTPEAICSYAKKIIEALL